jgi:NADH-quinone oxidoreductase subunit C
MTSKLDNLQEALAAQLGARVKKLERAYGELTLTVAAADYLEAATILRDHPDLAFEQLIDLCGVDYSSYRDVPWEGPRFCVVTQVASLTDVWSAANWFEREAFDLFGVIFDGHIDLRRILTDYGFIGHPFRKDFPVSGTVEMRYDPDQKRVIYQPVTIEPREIIPRVIREDNYGGLH